jgi:cytochrome c553
MIEQGRDTFRNDTFGDEAFWNAIQLNKGIEAVDPKTALAVGLKVDSEKLDAATIDAIKSGAPALSQPATTLALLKADAVVGVKAQVSGQSITSLGITCALCHSNVDNSVAAGVGRRQDGWPNRDLDVGKIVSLAKNLAPVVALLNSGGASFTPQQVVASILAWGPGKFDAEVFMDGKAGPNPVTGKSAATLIPAAFGLAGVNLHTYTGWGSVTHWNAFVANLEMHGVGNFFDSRLDDAAKFPIAANASNHFGHVTTPPADDKVTSKLAALHFYQLSLDAPKPPASSFDAAAAARGKAVFEDANKGKCAKCHIPPLYTEPGWNMHSPADIGIEAFQADRAPDGKYRTTPLRGLWARMSAAPVSEANAQAKTGHGFYHDGRYLTFDALLDHYANDPPAQFKATFTGTDRADLIEYLKSL